MSKNAVSMFDRLLTDMLAELETKLAAVARAEVKRIGAPLAARAGRIEPRMRRTAEAFGVRPRHRRRRPAPQPSPPPQAAEASATWPWFLDHQRAHQVLAKIVADYGLARRPAEVFAALVAGVPRANVAGVLGVAENSVKTFTKVLLARLKQRNLSAAIWWARKQIVASPESRRRRRRGSSQRRRSAPVAADQVPAE